MQSQNVAFVTAAYAISWVVLLGYLIHVHRALAKARAEYNGASRQREGTQ